VRAQTGGSPQAIASIKSLAQLHCVRQMNGKRSVTYYSLLFDQHEIIKAIGLAVGSFYQARYGLSLLTTFQRLQVFSIFPKLRSDPENGYGPRAPCSDHPSIRCVGKNASAGFSPQQICQTYAA